MLPMVGYLGNVLIALVAAGAVYAVWVANRKRIAAETVGRAEEQALRIVKDAERDAEARKKEVLLDAKEKAHELFVEAERERTRERQQLQALEQTLTRRESSIGELQARIERIDRKSTRLNSSHT